MNSGSNSARSNPKAVNNRNITPNFLRFKRTSISNSGKSKSGKPEDEGLDSNGTERSGSKGASKMSF